MYSSIGINENFYYDNYVLRTKQMIALTNFIFIFVIQGNGNQFKWGKLVTEKKGDSGPYLN